MGQEASEYILEKLTEAITERWPHYCNCVSLGSGHVGRKSCVGRWEVMQLCGDTWVPEAHCLTLYWQSTAQQGPWCEREKFTLLSAVVVTITRRAVDLSSNSGAETSCVKSTSSHSLETPKQRATGEVCRTAKRSHQAHSPRLSSPGSPSLVSS